MKNVFLATFLLVMLLTSCEKNLCSRCSYTRPDNGAMVEGKECFYGESEEKNDTWEATFKEEVRALGGDWENLEITCERYLAE